ncbi:MAG: hypothetical protein WAT71_04005 [Ignavibacteria bacterium]
MSSHPTELNGKCGNWMYRWGRDKKDILENERLYYLMNSNGKME